jgi:hypothetical protein
MRHFADEVSHLVLRRLGYHALHKAREAFFRLGYELANGMRCRDVLP